MVRLHPKHGLNPTMSQCIICGGDKGEIALLGAAYKGEAPMHMVTSLKPCDECRAKYLVDGVMLAESDEKRNPTGSLVVIKVEAYQRLFGASVPPGHIALVEQGMFSRLGLN